MQYLCHKDSLPHAKTLRLQWEGINRKQQDLNRLNDKDRHRSYLAGRYEPPKPSIKLGKVTAFVTAPSSKQHKTTFDTKFSNRTTTWYNTPQLREEKFQSQLKIYKLHKQNHRLSSKLYECQRELNHLSRRNHNKKISRRDMKIQALIVGKRETNTSFLHLQKKIVSSLNYHRQEKIKARNIMCDRVLRI